MFIDSNTLEEALLRLYGTAGHLLKIWFTLKHMGLSDNSSPIVIDTSNSTPSLQRLFSCGAPDGRFYIPFAHTMKFAKLEHDASRSIIQTTVRRWASSDSVVTCDPKEYLDFVDENNKLTVATGRRYPLGLGIGKNGFALKDETRVSIPIISFAVWYGRQTEIPIEADPSTFLTDLMLRELNISVAERSLIFVDDNLVVNTQADKLSDSQIFAICQPFFEGEHEPTTKVYFEEYRQHSRRVRGMVSNLNLPSWMRVPPEEEVKQLIETGAKAILLFGPPRTGKTRVIDRIIARDHATRCTIQIHDGWGYDHLVEGFKPDEEGNWKWKDGPLKEALSDGKKFIVLEEVNRTAISQALGEVFSLVEDTYRGEGKGIILRSGKKFWIPEDVVFLMSMNTIDKSTEDIDDALLGRVAAVEFPPRPEDLKEMLTANRVPTNIQENIAQLFAEIQDVYLLGHGYFAGLSGDVSNKQVISYYKARVRPVLLNFLGDLKRQELAKIDNLVDELFTEE